MCEKCLINSMIAVNVSKEQYTVSKTLLNLLKAQREAEETGKTQVAREIGIEINSILGIEETEMDNAKSEGGVNSVSDTDFAAQETESYTPENNQIDSLTKVIAGILGIDPTEIQVVKHKL